MGEAKQSLIKIAITSVIIIIVLAIVGRCANKHIKTVNEPIIEWREREVKVPVYVPGKTEVKIVYKTKTIYVKDTAKVYVNKYLKDTTLSVKNSTTQYKDAVVKDSIVYAGYLVSHDQTLYINPRLDSATVVIREQVVREVVEVEKPQRSQLYVGVNTDIDSANGFNISPQVGLKLRNGYFFTLSKSLTCKNCGSISFNLPLRILRN